MEAGVRPRSRRSPCARNARGEAQKGSGVRRYQVLRLKDEPNYVMIDLEFDSAGEAEAFLQKMQRIWDGPAKGVMQNPRGRIAEIVEAGDLPPRRA